MHDYIQTVNDASCGACGRRCALGAALVAGVIPFAINAVHCRSWNQQGMMGWGTAKAITHLLADVPQAWGTGRQSAAANAARMWYWGLARYPQCAVLPMPDDRLALHVIHFCARSQFHVDQVQGVRTRYAVEGKAGYPTREGGSLEDVRATIRHGARVSFDRPGDANTLAATRVFAEYESIATAYTNSRLDIHASRCNRQLGQRFGDKPSRREDDAKMGAPSFRVLRSMVNLTSGVSGTG